MRIGVIRQAVAEAVCTEPFELPGSLEAAVLCIHGFTSTPYEVRGLAMALHERGFGVKAPLLPGHGTRVEDLATTTWRQWADAVEGELEGLLRRYPRVAVLGQSLGGLLSLHVAARRREVAAVVSLAAPLWLEGLGGRLARLTAPGGWLHGRLAYVPKLGGSDVADPQVKATYPSYQKIPMAALSELCAFMNVADAGLPSIAAPTLVMHSRLDHTAPVACASRIAARARAEVLRLFDRSFHLLSVDLERDIVASEVGTFLSRHLLSH